MRAITRGSTWFRLALAAVCAGAQIAPLAAQATQTSVARPAAALPTRLSDAEFWKLVTDISEPGGYFAMADNFVSNERDIGRIAGMIRANGPTGGVYMGVGPEQNLTYIAAMRPRMVFIVDIRRQAVMHHLLYKAIFELSNDRADFISLLFAKPRPTSLDSKGTILQLWEAFAVVPMDSGMASKNRTRFRDHLTRTHGFSLTSEELAAFEHVYNSFVNYGPEITTGGPARGARALGGRAASRGGGAGNVVAGSADSATLARLRASVASVAIGSGGVDTGSVARVRGAAAAALYAAGTPPGFMGGSVNFVGLTTVTDSMGQYNSFLGSEDSFQFLKDLHTRNLFVPNSGNFGGPKATRAVGAYVKEHGAIVTAFYVSNVESYLFGDGIAAAFYNNVATLPVDEKSVFIRPTGLRTGTALCPIASMLRAVAAGRIVNIGMATMCLQ